jgi:DNA-binding MarR family transcriptional regulator
MNNSLTFCIQMARSTAHLTRQLDLTLSGLHGMSFNDFTILLSLQLAPDQKLRRVDLAQRMGLTPSGITRTLLPLEKLGWVDRLSDERDARIAYAVLTVQGAALLDNALITANEKSESLLRLLSSDQIDGLTQLLRDNLMA